MTDDAALAEEEFIAMESGAAAPAGGAALDTGEGIHSLLIPHVRPVGVAGEHLTGKRNPPAVAAEVISVKDDRVGPLSRIGRKRYVQLMMALHVELLKLQNYVKENRLKVVVLFEGREAAGKGGTIKQFTEHTNPRGCRTVALGAPSENERHQWHFQRFVEHLPTQGEIVLFHHSWYDLALTERVAGRTTESEAEEFLRSAPEFERMLVRSGIRLFKYYFTIGRAVQKKRLRRRTSHPLKHWKLKEPKLSSKRKWSLYDQAAADLFDHTSSPDAPWIAVDGNNKRRARINAVRHFLSSFDYPKDFPAMLDPDPRIVSPANGEAVARPTPGPSPDPAETGATRSA